MLAMLRSGGALSLGIALSVLTACGGPPPRAANPTRPLDERRAIELIIQAFRDEHDRPVPGGDVSVGGNKKLHVDVVAQERKYGVSYVSGPERWALAGALPPRDPSMGDALPIVPGQGDDADARILILYDSDYVYDDHVGEAHEQSTLATELRLKRDVHDFLVHAHTEKFP
jgi:hypothetical protein